MRSDDSKSSRRHHPGSGRGRGRHVPRGRQVDAHALAEIRALLDGQSRRRDLLIEHLHRVQDRYGCLSPAHLAALAEHMNLPLAEVYEVATFYAHFDVLDDGQEPPPPVTIRVCDSLTCEIMGASALHEALQRDAPANVRVLRAPCVGRCDHAPVAVVGRRQIDDADAGSVLEAARSGRTEPDLPDYVGLAAYRRSGGFDLLERCLDGDMERETVLAELERGALRGLGGAGFPTARKWHIVHSAPAPRLMAVNADEGESGTFKDRYYLERDPLRFLEGVLIGAWAVEAEAVYIYLRDEYPAVRTILLAELPQLETAGWTRHTSVHLRRGAGAYICGEESAMIESIEGKRGLPRLRPPYVAETGLFGRPTLVQNVETLYWVRDILEQGGEWAAGHGRNGGVGLRSYSVSGRVREPGVKQAPAGISVRELIDEYCGGMQEGHTLKAYLPGGASGGILPARLDYLPLDFGRLEEHGCFIGSHALIVLSDHDDVRAAALNLMRFFEDESCGQCTPCRVGTEKAAALMSRPVWDEPLLGALAQTMADASICGLGQAAPNPLRCVLEYFPEELE
ncbi:NAD(P)H-dependent oxidoreductase subunit E [Lentisalinibacter salinarum]|uniref:NAD(P)H-dependent oxidoreductase subunit E n=1 Tax=Lentisalinibacter salinarum TaxID=2992239 RepID=UPI003867B143